MTKLKTEGLRESQDNTVTMAYINGIRSLSSNNVTVLESLLRKLHHHRSLFSASS